MDVVYCLRNSAANNLEIRYSLRSLARHFPTVGKVWIFGDKPTFLSDDTSLIEHVPHDYIAPVFGFRTPIVNHFKMVFASSQIPGLSSEFLSFSDDYILLSELTPAAARTVRFLEDLDKVANRGQGLWNESLWRTHALLKRLGYPGLNYETHTPAYFQRKWVFEAYRVLRDFVTEDRFFGILGITAIMNYTITRHDITPVNVYTENTRVGFWGRQPVYQQIAESCQGKLFLNFDDRAFGPAVLQFLRERFPEKCRYEKAGEDRSNLSARANMGCFQAIAGLH